MMNKKSCVDAGREGCPCFLFKGGNCLVCSRSKGFTCDECNWQGSCIYTLFKQNGMHVKVPSRKEQILKIVWRKMYSENFVVIGVKCSYGFCQKCLVPGAYLFLKKDKSPWFDMPISVLKVDMEKTTIYFGINIEGGKSGQFREEIKEVIVRGVYYNGVTSMNKVSEESLVIAKGIGIAPLRNFLDEKVIEVEKTRLYVDLSKVGEEFFKDFFPEFSVGRLFIANLKEELENILEKERGFCGNVFALTSPYYVDKIEKFYGGKVVKPKEERICCGEGLCGACSFDDENGNTIYRCKWAR